MKLSSLVTICLILSGWLTGCGDSSDPLKNHPELKAGQLFTEPDVQTPQEFNVQPVVLRFEKGDKQVFTLGFEEGQPASYKVIPTFRTLIPNYNLVLLNPPDGMKLEKDGESSQGWTLTWTPPLLAHCQQQASLQHLTLEVQLTEENSTELKEYYAAADLRSHIDYLVSPRQSLEITSSLEPKREVFTQTDNSVTLKIQTKGQGVGDHTRLVLVPIPPQMISNESSKQDAHKFIELRGPPTWKGKEEGWISTYTLDLKSLQTPRGIQEGQTYRAVVEFLVTTDCGVMHRHQVQIPVRAGRSLPLPPPWPTVVPTTRNSK